MAGGKLRKANSSFSMDLSCWIRLEYDPKLQEQVSRGVETLPRTACYLMSGSLFSLRVVLNAESGALRSQNTPGGYGSLAFSGEAR